MRKVTEQLPWYSVRNEPGGLKEEVKNLVTGLVESEFSRSSEVVMELCRCKIMEILLQRTPSFFPFFSSFLGF